MLTQEEAARLRIKARHGELTPEEQLMYSEYMESQGETYNTSPNGQAQTAQPVQSGQVVMQPTAQDSGSAGWAVLGFFFPIVGLILYLVWKTEKPLSARRAGMGALVSVIVGVVITVIWFILAIVAMMSFGASAHIMY